MKRLLILLFLCLSVSTSRSDNELLTISPEHPQRGGPVTVTYDPTAPAAVLKDAGSPWLLTMLVGEDNTLTLVETPMTASGKLWKAGLTIPGEGVVFAILKITEGEKTDDNAGSFWDLLVAGKDGAPVKSARAVRGASFAFGGYAGFRRTKDPVIARAEFATELKLYPDNWRAIVNGWSLDLSGEPVPGTTARIASELKEYCSRFRSDDEAYSAAIPFLEQTGDSTNAKGIRAEILARSPGGSYARKSRTNDALREKDAGKRAAMLEAILKDFPGMEISEQISLASRLVSALVQQKELQKAAGVLKSYPRVSGSVYNQLAWAMIGQEGSRNEGVEWARKGVDAARHPDPALKAGSMKKADWDENNEYALAGVLDTYGYGLTAQGNFADAVKHLAEAYALTKGDDGEINEHYIDALIGAKSYDTAIGVGVESIRKGNATDAIQTGMKSAFAAKENASGYEQLGAPGKEKFEKLVADAREAMKADIRKKLGESRLSLPAIDFSLPRLDGDPVTLSALKGKVVVVDFWATWCGPCRSSFPFLQKVYERFKDNPDVMILAVNTWERVKEKQAVVDNAKKFMTDNAYTFPVLFDDHAVSDYDVEGIPTKFIIDRQGKIAFKEVGFDGPKMEDELTMQIQMLLDEGVGTGK